jgi:flavin-dependent dehydrogenase
MGWLSDGNFHFAIAGGGPAGSAAGILLARAGKRVVLYEKESTAHHKVCGEYLSAEAQYYLRILGIDPVALGAVPITHMELSYANRYIQCPLPTNGASLSRKEMDEALLYLAAAEGVDVRRGIRVSNPHYDYGQWHVSTAQEDANAPALILATGKHDIGALPRYKGRQNEFIGFKMYYRLNQAQEAELTNRVSVIFFRGGYAGLQPKGHGVANLCLVIDKKIFESLGKSWAALLEYLLTSNRLLRERLDMTSACWSKPLSIYKIPYGLIQHDDHQPGLYRLGDQIAVIPSFTGSGISIALHTAFLAATNVLNADATAYKKEVYSSLYYPVRVASLISQLSCHSVVSQLLTSNSNFARASVKWLFSQTRLATKG